MSKTWFSYMALAIGMMLLFASEDPASAGAKSTSKEVSFGTEQKMEVFIDKAGTNNPSAKVIIDGKSYSFDIPDLAEGESKTITTENGEEIIVHSLSGNNMVWIDGKEINLPPLDGVGKEGLSALISSTHNLHISDDITITGRDLPEDVKASMIDAINGVLTSYDLHKKVNYQDRGKGLFKIHRFNTDANDGENNFNIKIEKGDLNQNGDMKVMFIGKDRVEKHEVIIETEESDKTED